MSAQNNTQLKREMRILSFSREIRLNLFLTNKLGAKKTMDIF